MSSLSVSNDSEHDADLRKRVELAFAYTQRASLSRVEIEVANGEVTLHGEVPSQKLRGLAYEITRRVAGVVRVNIDLTVKNAEPAPATVSVSTLTPRLVSRVAIWMLAVSSFTGCGQSEGDRVQVFPAEGQVQLNGQPLADAFVVLHPRNPADARTQVARGQTDQSGKFQLTTYEAHDGAAAGEYAVTVQHYKLVQSGDSYAAGPNVLPPKLAAPETTDITVRIAEGPNQLQPIEVKQR